MRNRTKVLIAVVVGGYIAKSLIDGANKAMAQNVRVTKNATVRNPLASTLAGLGCAPSMNGLGCGMAMNGLGCAPSLNGLGDDGLGGLKKFFKKPQEVLKKIIAPANKIVKKINAPIKTAISKVNTQIKQDISRVNAQIKRDFANVSAPVIRDFTKAASLVKRDFSNAVALLRYYDPLVKKLFPYKQPDAVTGAMLYYDANGNEISEAEYNRLMVEAEKLEREMELMRASAGGNEIMFDPDTGLYWYLDPKTNQWYQWDMSAHHWFSDSVQITPPEDEGDDMIDEGNGGGGGGGESQGDGGDGTFDGSLPDGVAFDDVTGLYWWQDPESGAWWYSSTADGEYKLEASSSASSQMETRADEAGSYGQSVYEDAEYLERLANSRTSSSDEVEGTWDESTGKYWHRDRDGDFWWWSDDIQAWQPDGAVVPQVVEQVNPYSREELGWDGWGVGSLGHLANVHTGNRLYVMRALGNGVETSPVLADKYGKIFTANGGGMHALGDVDDIAGEEGLGFKVFGRSYGQIRDNVEKVAKDVAGHVTPSGAIYSYIKKNNPNIYKSWHKGVKDTSPYLLIVGGTVLSVASYGAASPAGAAMIAAGVAQAGAQGYSDYAKREAQKDADQSQKDYDAEQARQIEQAALQSAETSATDSLLEKPFYDWDWWLTGDPDYSYV